MSRTRTPYRVIFFGTPEFSVPALHALVDAAFDVAMVVTQPEKGKNRGQVLSPSPVKVAAEKLHLLAYQPRTLGKTEVYATLKEVHADVGVVVAYGKLIPASLLSLPRLGMVNVHPSLLPALRGPAPIQYAILEGMKETGISMMLMDEGMDTGPILHQSIVRINDEETFLTLNIKLASQAATILTDQLRRYLSGEITPKPQTTQGVSYSKLLEREDGKVNFSESAVFIERKIRALHPWPGVYCEIDGKRIKILKAHIGSNGPLVVTCATGGQLSIEILQLEGKKPISGQNFVRGYPSLAKKFAKKWERL